MKTTMMMKNICLALCLLTAGTLYAQKQLSQAQKDEIRTKAMSVIEKGYETYATVNGEENRAAFLNLFASQKAIVYNDLLGLSYAPSLLVAEYVRLLGDASVTSKRVNVRNIKAVGEPRYENGHWKQTVSFDKDMTYYNACGIFFSSREFYDADYNLKAVLVYNEDNGSCLIERITGMIETYNDLPEEFFVLKHASAYDETLHYNAKPVKFNSGNQVIIPGTFNSSAFANTDREVKGIIPEVDNDCHIVTMRYIDTEPAPSLRLKAHFDLPLGGVLKLDGDDAFSTKKSAGMGIGVDLGVKLVDMDKLRLYGFAGVGISTTSLELEQNLKNYSVPEDMTDIDGDTYTRHYDNLNLKQKVSMVDIAIPVYADLEYGLNKEMAIYADLGLRFNLNMSKKLEDNGSRADKVYGTYNGGFGNSADDVINWAKEVGGVLGLGQNANGFTDTPNISGATLNDLEGVSGMSMDALLGLGFRYTIPKTQLTIDLGASMVYGLGDVIKPETGQKAIYNTLSDLKSTEHVSSLTNRLESIKRQALRVSLGLIYNF